MKKKNYKYHIQVNMVHDKENKECPSARLEFDLENHDDIFRIITYICVTAKKVYKRCACGVDSIYFKINDDIVEILAIVERQDLKNIL